MTPKIIEYQIVRIAPGYHSCPEIAAEIKRGWQPKYEEPKAWLIPEGKEQP